MPSNSSKKKKRGQRAVGGDKSGRGLRQFSMKGVLLHPKSVFLLKVKSSIAMFVLKLRHSIACMKIEKLDLEFFHLDVDVLCLCFHLVRTFS